jgi:hypothetical protein
MLMHLIQRTVTLINIVFIFMKFVEFYYSDTGRILSASRPQKEHSSSLGLY